MDWLILAIKLSGLFLSCWFCYEAGKLSGSKRLEKSIAKKREAERIVTMDIEINRLSGLVGGQQNDLRQIFADLTSLKKNYHILKEHYETQRSQTKRKS